MKTLIKISVYKDVKIEDIQNLEQDGYKQIKHLGNIKWKQFTEPHQKRVIDEALELTDKLDKLWEFIKNNPIFKNLSNEEQTRLKQQESAMAYYLTILVERIDNFK